MFAFLLNAPQPRLNCFIDDFDENGQMEFVRKNVSIKRQINGAIKAFMAQTLDKFYGKFSLVIFIYERFFWKWKRQNLNIRFH